MTMIDNSNIIRIADITNIIKCRDNFSNQDVGGYRHFANHIKGY